MNEDINEKKEVKGKKRKSALKIIIVIMILLVIFGALVFASFKVIKFVKDRLNNINYVEIDKGAVVPPSEDKTNIEQPVEEIDEIISIALFGSDSRNVQNMYAGRADSIIIASVNTKLKSIKLMSIPRDTYVNIPGHGFDKINHAYAFGGEQLLLQTINYNFGIEITEYMTVDFLGMANLINKIGGVPLNISEEEMQVINKCLVEIYRLENRPYEAMTNYGSVLLNGEQAVAHCRNRYIGSDFVRARRQRDVIISALNKISQADYQDAVGYIDYGLSQIKTNADVNGKWSTILNILLNLKTYKENIISVQIPSLEYGYDSYINGIYYFGSDLERAKQDFHTYIYEK